MQNTILTQLSFGEFKELIKASIAECLTENSAAFKDEANKLFSIKEAADFLNLAPQTLYGYTSNRTIPFIKKGKKLYFRRSDLDKWLMQGRKLTMEEIGDAIFKKGKGGKYG